MRPTTLARGLRPRGPRARAPPLHPKKGASIVSGTERRKLATTVSLRLDPAAASAVQAAADAAGQSRSSWARDHVLNAVDVDGAAAPKTKPRKTGRVVSADQVELARLVRYVDRLNGAIVQLAIRERDGGRLATLSTTQILLADLRSLADELRKAISG